jgi:hypothetical protein
MAHNELFLNFRGKSPLENKYFYPFFELRHSLESRNPRKDWMTVLAYVAEYLRRSWGDTWTFSLAPSPLTRDLAVEFKLVYPVRLQNGKTAKENLYYMNFFSRFFEFGYINKEIRNDGVVQSREYYIAFNTILGEFFAHNLLSENYDWVEPSFYTLPYSAQILCRRFLIHNDFLYTQVNLKTIVEKLNLTDKNTTNLIKTIEESALKPLIEQGLIHSYEKEEGLQGLKFIIKRLKRVQPNKDIV